MFAEGYPGGITDYAECTACIDPIEDAREGLADKLACLTKAEPLVGQ